jgi:hypothetical protein
LLPAPLVRAATISRLPVKPLVMKVLAPSIT